jgi:transcriptional regulator with XRE-family HTH domain
MAPEISQEEWAYFHLNDTISDKIAKFMDTESISNAELARRMNKKPSFISRILSGDANPTLKTLANIFFHLDVKLETRIVHVNDNLRWFAITNIDTDSNNEFSVSPRQFLSTMQKGANVNTDWTKMQEVA